MELCVFRININTCHVGACCAVRTCGLPRIQSERMSNLTVRPGERVTFNCRVKHTSCLAALVLFCHC